MQRGAACGAASIFWRRSAKYAVSSSADFTLPREHEPVEHPPPVPHDEHPPPPEPHPGLPQPSAGSGGSVGDRRPGEVEQPNGEAEPRGEFVEQRGGVAGVPRQAVQDRSRSSSVSSASTNASGSPRSAASSAAASRSGRARRTVASAASSSARRGAEQLAVGRRCRGERLARLAQHRAEFDAARAADDDPVAARRARRGAVNRPTNPDRPYCTRQRRVSLRPAPPRSR